MDIDGREKLNQLVNDIDVNEIEGVAIMTDTDNSKKLAIAYYQNIYFSEN